MHNLKLTNKRKIFMPIAIILAAVAIASWGWQNESDKVNEVREYVLLICEDVANGRDLDSRLGQLNPTIAKRMVDSLKVLCQDLPEDLAGLEIVVHSGDALDIGNGTATHTAMIRTKGTDKLGLRIVYQRMGGDMGIIGIWWPQ